MRISCFESPKNSKFVWGKREGPLCWSHARHFCLRSGHWRGLIVSHRVLATEQGGQHAVAELQRKTKLVSDYGSSAFHPFSPLLISILIIIRISTFQAYLYHIKLFWILKLISSCFSDHTKQIPNWSYDTVKRKLKFSRSVPLNTPFLVHLVHKFLIVFLSGEKHSCAIMFKQPTLYLLFLPTQSVRTVTQQYLCSKMCTSGDSVGNVFTSRGTKLCHLTRDIQTFVNMLYLMWVPFN